MDKYINFLTLWRKLTQTTVEKIKKRTGAAVTKIIKYYFVCYFIQLCYLLPAKVTMTIFMVANRIHLCWNLESLFIIWYIFSGKHYFQFFLGKNIDSEDEKTKNINLTIQMKKMYNIITNDEPFSSKLNYRKR